MLSPIRRLDAYGLDGHRYFLLIADSMLMPLTSMVFFAYSATVAYALDGHLSFQQGVGKPTPSLTGSQE
jgi:hypothetical protein